MLTASLAGKRFQLFFFYCRNRAGIRCFAGLIFAVGIDVALGSDRDVVVVHGEYGGAGCGAEPAANAVFVYTEFHNSSSPFISAEYMSVGRNGNNLPWNKLSAVSQRAPRRVLKTSAAGDFHTDDGHAFYVVAAYYVRKLPGIINGIELRAADECDAPHDEFLV